MPCVIRVYINNDIRGVVRYLKTYDVEAHGGRGDATFTDDPNDALCFPNAAEALKAWQTRSVTRPDRPDGKPNRPLTAFTVEIMSLPESAAA